MLVIICGPSGAGKTKLSRELVNEYGFFEVVSYTTRTPRENEIDGVDYHFVSPGCFKDMQETNEFVEFEEYSQNRFYGTTKEDVKKAAESENFYVLVATPNGMRAISRELSEENVVKVAISADLGSRVKRYIDRIGTDKFSFDDMNEINARVNRDFGMFLNIEREVDIAIDNSGENKSRFLDIAETVYEAICNKQNKKAKQEEIEFGYE